MGYTSHVSTLDSAQHSFLASTLSPPSLKWGGVHTRTLSSLRSTLVCCCLNSGWFPEEHCTGTPAHMQSMASEEDAGAAGEGILGWRIP